MTLLCNLEEIGNPGSRGFQVEAGGTHRDIMVIRRGNEVHGYINSCPHTGACLDWQPGEFLNLQQTLIMCATHGAEFRIEDGYCVGGPCVGDKLAAVDLTIDEAGRILCPIGQFAWLAGRS